jgi:hypothetical protein
MGFGGTIDFYGTLDGVLTLCDLKTGSGIYDEHYYQICAYRQLLQENGRDVQQARIINIPRKDNEDFTEKIYTSFDRGLSVFQHCLAIYTLQKEKT